MIHESSVTPYGSARRGPQLALRIAPGLFDGTLWQDLCKLVFVKLNSDDSDVVGGLGITLGLSQFDRYCSHIFITLSLSSWPIGTALICLVEDL